MVLNNVLKIPAGESIGCHSGGDHSDQAQVLLAVLYHREGQNGRATEVVFASAVDGPILDETCVAPKMDIPSKFCIQIISAYFNNTIRYSLQSMFVHISSEHLTHVFTATVFDSAGVPDQSIEAGFKRALSQQGK